MATLWPAADELDGISEHQREQYALATRGPVAILGGNPGTGKTYLTAKILKAIDANKGLGLSAVCAPTGKAAQRVNELLESHGVYGLTATTIHRLLSVSRNGYDKKGWGFKYGKETPLPHRYIVVDESSMLSTSLLASLLEATREGAHLLLVGDFAQLPPVEHGAPLRDLIAAGLPYGELTEPHRNEGAIVRACRDVKEGRPYQPCTDTNTTLGNNLWHIEAKTPEEITSALMDALRIECDEIDPMWGRQVIVSTNARRQELNQLIQKLVNPHGRAAEGLTPRSGDKVICLSNGWRPVIACTKCNFQGDRHIAWNSNHYDCKGCDGKLFVNELPEDFVANGEMGLVSFVSNRLMHVEFDSPRRVVRVDKGDLINWDLAYAITTHKAQGSQWNQVFVVCDSGGGADMVTSMEWHRTAWSRAQKMCVTIGQLSAIHRQCRRRSIEFRKTFLKELYQEYSGQKIEIKDEIGNGLQDS